MFSINGLIRITGCVLLVTQFSLGQTATYEVTFQGMWNSADHPFPGGAHFSPLVGANHNDSVEFWVPGGVATNGIERMAESGSIIPLRNEVNAAGSDNATAMFGAGISAAGRTTMTVDIDAHQPLLTLVSMIAPSPDWFVGTSGFDLRPNGQWVDNEVYELFAYDAGTDSGTNFTSPNSDTNPQEPIAMLGAPLAGMPALGSFTFDLISVTGAIGDFDADGILGLTDVDALVGEIAGGANVTSFDLTGDGQVDGADLTEWLAIAGSANLASGNAYLVGDANLNGNVDVADFNLWNANRFTSDTLWSGADFNADGVTDVADFNLFNANRFTSADSASLVPEPATASLLLSSLLVLTGGWRRRQANRERTTIGPTLG